MSKFKVGDMAWSARHGFQVLQRCNSEGYPISHGMSTYSLNGMFQPEDLHPSLLTVEEVAKLGYYPPKKKIKKKFYTGAYTSQYGNPAISSALYEDITVAKSKCRDLSFYDLGIAIVTIEVEE